MGELKPCPFCGGEAVIEQVGSTRHSSVIGCTNCHCTVEANENERTTGNHWNTRSPTPTAETGEVSVEELARDLYENVCRQRNPDAPTWEANTRDNRYEWECVARRAMECLRRRAGGTLDVDALARAACVAYHNDTTVWEFIADDEREQWKHAALAVRTPAPVARRVTVEEVWTAFDEARRRAKILRTSAREQDEAGLRAVIALFQEGSISTTTQERPQ